MGYGTFVYVVGGYGTVPDGTVLLFLFLGFTGRYRYPVLMYRYVVYRYGTDPKVPYFHAIFGFESQ